MSEISKQISPEEVGKRLLEARKNRRLGQEEVAQALEISRPTLIAIEKGTRPAKPQELITLAKLYGRSLHELVSARPFIAGFAPQFRITQSATILPSSVVEATQIFQRACENYLRLERWLDLSSSRSISSPDYDVSRNDARKESIARMAEEIATLERSRLQLGQGSLPNLMETLENEAGLRVFVLPLDEFKIAGMFAYSDEMGGCILVNGKHPYTRQRWTIVHEYAHFLTDRYREEITLLADYERRPLNEQFADYFAAAFLMPEAGLRQRFRRIVGRANDFTVADLCQLALQYGVSMEAMTRRLEQLRCIPAGMWDKLSADGLKPSTLQSHLKIKTPEATRRHLPERYTRMAVQAFEEAQIT
ncbi:MAG: ImmA/IrrE family metallo-endopeptidase, partial [Chthonomonadaceae bacterium]|nr:ImmA/IrrE family metallo-endopeptidase [Chthonomonadaceae bacterium]